MPVFGLKIYCTGSKNNQKNQALFIIVVTIGCDCKNGNLIGLYYTQKT